MEKPDEAVQSWRNHVAYGVGILFSLFHCWNAYAGTFPGQQLTTIHLTGTLIIGFLLKPNRFPLIICSSSAPVYYMAQPSPGPTV